MTHWLASIRISISLVKQIHLSNSCSTEVNVTWTKILDPKCKFLKLKISNIIMYIKDYIQLKIYISKITFKVFLWVKNVSNIIMSIKDYIQVKIYIYTLFSFFFQRVFTRVPLMSSLCIVFQIVWPDHLTAWPGSDCGSVPCMTLLDCVSSLCSYLSPCLCGCRRSAMVVSEVASIPPQNTSRLHFHLIRSVSYRSQHLCCFPYLMRLKRLYSHPVTCFQSVQVLGCAVVVFFLSLSVVHQSLYVTCYLWLQQSLFKGPCLPI